MNGEPHVFIHVTVSIQCQYHRFGYHMTHHMIIEHLQQSIEEFFGRHKRVLIELFLPDVIVVMHGLKHKDIITGDDIWRSIIKSPTEGRSSAKFSPGSLQDWMASGFFWSKNHTTEIACRNYWLPMFFLIHWLKGNTDNTDMKWYWLRK